MGSLFGSFFAKSGENVFLIDIWQEHVDKINDKGVEIEFKGKKSRVGMKASTNIDEAPESDLVIVFVKSSQTEQAALQALQCLNSSGLVLTLQNGMGNADTISHIVDPEKVVAGTTSHGATILCAGAIRHAGAGPTIVGMWSGKKSEKLENIREMFGRAGIDIVIEDNIHLIVWKKLIINVGINAITALTGIKNGSIVDTHPTGELVRSAVKESCDVALAHGVKLPEDIAEQVFQVAKATGLNRSSMGQDVDNRRQTEIDAINGAVVSLAQKKGIKVPVNRTLTALIKTMQKHYKE